MAQHKPGSLKQKNKKHKGKDGKRAQNKGMGAGKTNGLRKSAKSSANKRDNKAERLNRNNQLRKIKRDSAWLHRRAANSGSSSSHANVKVIGILPLSEDGDARTCLGECYRQLGVQIGKHDVNQTVFHTFDTTDRTHLTFVVPPSGLQRDLFFALELARSVDLLVFAVNSTAPSPMIDEAGLSTLSAMKAMGCPDAVFAVDMATPASGAMDDGTAARARKGQGGGASRKAVHQQLEDTALLPGARIVDIDTASTSSSGGSGGNMLIRTLRNIAPKPVVWRAQRSYLLADAASVQVQQSEGEETCRVRVTGYLRGRPMPVHSLMHLVGVGAGRVVSVTQAGIQGSAGSTNNAQTVVADKERQESLELEAAGNSLMGEQTWPTEEELRMAGQEDSELQGQDRSAGRDRRTLSAQALVPKGMSSYQADWFMDEEGHLDFSGRSGGAGAGEGGAGNEEGDGSSIADDMGDEMTLGAGTLSGKKSVAGSGVNSKGVPYTLKERQELDEAFPDEMDTPDDISARLRFARYRALESFRGSPWHPKENLPQDYARIFQFENFAGTQRRLLAESKAAQQKQLQAALEARKSAKSSGSVAPSSASAAGSRHRTASSAGSGMESEMAVDEEDEGSSSQGSEDSGSEGSDGEDEEEGMEVAHESSSGQKLQEHVQDDGFLVPGDEDFVQSGQFVCVELESVPQLVVARLQQYGFLLCHALYEHEQKLSVLHFHVQKYPAYQEPLKSKDELLFVVGFRSFLTKPVFSESNLNCDKHKFERFLLPDRFSMASCYGPTFVSAVPLLVFKRAAYAGEGGGFRGRCGADWALVATGSLANVEPDRIMLKKIVLTGFPIRVRKRFAVVKHMFHEPQDVRWFKPAELVTKWGLRGHITEPVGTHGLYKALFNGAIKQNDTVMLVLYKRVYPKFPSAGLQLQ